ncbi:SAG-related sequence SRS32 [Besnoitia besnoiti]|uniref:SAG-related sequence SRS32 n=1 Tax=Besnoitia besnoiti TaxID=94643 RepID=A0A2A9MFR8_BESBE|nr:SAG-related sequence SRS32 [Besnoitia besnoiti]PFH37338.1 SAG-related sequence SRS32 [Besnoitia besnoiti]
MILIKRPEERKPGATDRVGARLHSVTVDVPTCSESGTVLSVHVSARTKRAYFKCGTHLPILDPPVSAALAYTAPSCKSAIPLADQVPTMTCVFNRPRNLYVVTLKQLPAHERKTIYYRCMEPGSPAACRVVVHVPPAPPDPQSPRGSSPSEVQSCSTSGTTITVEASIQTKKAQFKCGGGMFQLDPPFLADTTYTARSCTKPVPLRTQVAGSLFMSPFEDDLYTLQLKTFPVDRPRTLYYVCTSPGSSRSCKVAIHVPLDPTATQDVARYHDIPECSESGATVTAFVSPNTRAAQFKCGPALFELYPPLAFQNAYGSRACVTPIPLGDIVSGTLSLAAGGNNLYTLQLSGLPARKPKDMYFKCMAPDGSSSCKVHIKVPKHSNSLRALKAPKIHVCYPGPDASLRIRASAYSSFYIRCAAGLSHSPTVETDVYDNLDGSCSSAGPLDRHVKGAELVRAPQVRRVGTTYIFSVEELPEVPQQLCYLCAPNSNLRTEECRILITVPARNYSTSRGLPPPTRPPSPSAQGRPHGALIMAILQVGAHLTGCF